MRAVDRAIVVLHELGHAFNILFSDDPAHPVNPVAEDAGLPGVSGTNSERIRTACFPGML
jgi:hypothetical protein